MTSSFDSFDQSALGEFLQSALHERGGGGRVKLIGNALQNRPLSVWSFRTFSEADGALFISANMSVSAPTFWTLRVAGDMNIVWQRKHVVPIPGFTGFSVEGYQAFPSNTLLVGQLVGIGAGRFLLIQSALNGSTVSVHRLSANAPGVKHCSKTGANTMVVMGDIGSVGALPFNNAYFGEISATPAMLNEFVIGRVDKHTTATAVFAHGDDIYASVESQGTNTLIKASLAGTIAWQKTVGGGPLAIVADNGSSRVYLARNKDIYALNTADGSFVWGKRLAGVFFPISHLADGGGIYAAYTLGGATVLIKLRAEDGSEIFARSFGHTSPGEEQLGPVGFAEAGEVLLLGALAVNHPEGFGNEDIMVGACKSTQSTNHALVYSDVTPGTMTDGAYSSASLSRVTFTSDTFDNQAGDLSIKDLAIDDFPE